MRPPILGSKAGPDPEAAGTKCFEYLLVPLTEHRFVLCKSGDPGEVTSTLGLSLLSYDSVDDVQEDQRLLYQLLQGRSDTHTQTRIRITRQHSVRWYIRQRNPVGHKLFCFVCNNSVDDQWGHV